MAQRKGAGGDGIEASQEVSQWSRAAVQAEPVASNGPRDMAPPKKSSRRIAAVAISTNAVHCSIRSCFAIIISPRYAQLVSICSKYMSQSSHIFQIFTLLLLEVETNMAEKSHFAAANSLTLSARKTLKSIFKGLYS